MAGRIKQALSVALILILLLLFNNSCENPLRKKIELYVSSYDSIKSEGIVYVSVNTGDDENPGTRDQPKKTIQPAVDLLQALMDTGEVHVAGGTYFIDESLELKEGISLYGGYSSADWSRDVTQYETIIQPDDVTSTVSIPEGVTSVTVIDGFTIMSALEDTVTVIYCSRSSPTIRNNIIEAGLGIKDSVGIYNDSSSPIVMSNTIDGGDGLESSWAILNVHSSPRIWNNVIYAGDSISNSKGIVNSDSSAAIIQNNTIYGGTGADAAAIYNSSSRCVIENNILFFSEANSCGIYEKDSSALPVKVNNNDFFDCDPVYDYNEGSCDTIADMENYLSKSPNSVLAVGNVSVDPKFVNQAGGDWHLSDFSPDSVTEGGLDLSDSFTTDRDGVTRTLPWSMGAYERDNS